MNKTSFVSNPIQQRENRAKLCANQAPLIDNMIAVFTWDQAWPATAIMGICIPSIFSLVKRGINGGTHSLFHAGEITVLSASGTSATCDTVSLSEKDCMAWSPPGIKPPAPAQINVSPAARQTFMHLNDSNESSVWGMTP